MKKIILILCFYACASVAQGQGRQLELVCTVYQTTTEFGQLDKFLPDSMRHLLAEPKRRVNMQQLDVVNLLCLRGWTLVAVSPKVNSSSTFGTTSEPVYYLKRVVPVSEEEYKAIQKRTQQYIK
jgi:hypothetical protein